MPKPPPPPLQPIALSIALDKLRIVVPIAAIVVLVGALAAVAMVALTPHQPVQEERVVGPAWAVDVRPAVFASLAQSALGGVPAPLNGQRLPPCESGSRAGAEGRLLGAGGRGALPAREGLPQRSGAWGGREVLRALHARGQDAHQRRAAHSCCRGPLNHGRAIGR